MTDFLNILGGAPRRNGPAVRPAADGDMQPKRSARGESFAVILGEQASKTAAADAAGSGAKDAPEADLAKGSAEAETMEDRTIDPDALLFSDEAEAARGPDGEWIGKVEGIETRVAAAPGENSRIAVGADPTIEARDTVSAQGRLNGEADAQRSGDPDQVASSTVDEITAERGGTNVPASPRDDSPRMKVQSAGDGETAADSIGESTIVHGPIATERPPVQQQSDEVAAAPVMSANRDRAAEIAAVRAPAVESIPQGYSHITQRGAPVANPEAHATAAQPPLRQLVEGPGHAPASTSDARPGDRGKWVARPGLELAQMPGNGIHPRSVRVDNTIPSASQRMTDAAIDAQVRPFPTNAAGPTTDGQQDSARLPATGRTVPIRIGTSPATAQFPLAIPVAATPTRMDPPPEAMPTLELHSTEQPRIVPDAAKPDAALVRSYGDARHGAAWADRWPSEPTSPAPMRGAEPAAQAMSPPSGASVPPPGTTIPLLPGIGQGGTPADAGTATTGEVDPNRHDVALRDVAVDPRPAQLAQATRIDTARHVTAQIAEAIRGGGDRPIEVVLNPAELGRVRLALSVTDAGLQVAIAADRGDTLELMRRHIDLLGQDLRDMGYDGTRFSFARDSDTGGSRRDAPPGDMPDSRARAENDAPSMPSASSRIAADRLDIRL